MIEDLTIKKLRSNLEESNFEEAYKNLLLDSTEGLTESDIRLLFKLALLFLNYGDYSLAKLGYRIILRYSNIFNDYQPLYDISLNKGYIPISRFIELTHFNSEQISQRFFNLFYSAFKDNFNQNGIYLSYGQRALVEFSQKTNNSFVLVAPTSYGKSDIIIGRVLANTHLRLCIIVPTKALLAQTKRRLLSNSELATKVKRVITHPEMYKGSEKEFVAVLTQERLLRLFQNNPNLSLDLILVDEAHNLLREDSRATLLAQVILIAQKRNSKVVLNFFTPFIAQKKNLESPYADYQLSEQQTTEYLKVERFYYIDFTGDKTLFIYDQFTDSNIEVIKFMSMSEIRFILKHASGKNIAYLNKPKNIEDLALRLSKESEVALTQEMQDSLNAISDFLHPQYNLLNCIRKGVVYHHGGMPDVIRLYVENLFTQVQGMRFIITNSTLLEGVNIPAEKIFILDNRIGKPTLTKSQFKNLIGRVCRFSEVFHEEKGNLNLLEPEIFLMKGDYAHKKTNLLAFLRRTAKSDLSLEDDVKNLLLVKDKSKLTRDQVEQLHNSLEYLENIEPNTIDASNITYVKSEIAKLCFANNVYDFDILGSENILVANLENNNHINDINTPESFMEALYLIFLRGVTLSEDDFGRLQNESARKFYSMILEWRSTGSSYKQMIGKFIRYWKDTNQTIIYAGRKWGEVTWSENSKRLLYVNLDEKTDAEKVNLAIHRIKEEQDFVDNNLIKYVEIFNDLGLINKDFYEKIKYGTSDKFLICLLKNGFSLDLAKCIMKPEYVEYVTINLEIDEVFLSTNIIEAMKAADENPVLIFEATYHIN